MTGKMRISLAHLAVAALLVGVLGTASRAHAQDDLTGTLTVSVIEGAMSGTVEPLAEMFAQMHPNVSINFVPEPEGGAFEALIAAGNQPDLLITSLGSTIGRLASQDVVLPLEELPGAQELLEQIVPTAVEPLYAHTYYIPIGADVTMMIYNKALFEEAGLDPDQAPTTWQEFLDAAEAIQALPARSDNQRVYGTVFWNEALAWGGWYWNMMQPIYLNANQDSCGLLNQLGTGIEFDKPECKMSEFFTFNKQAQAYAPPTMETNFFSRQIGMWPQYGYSWEPNLQEAAGQPMVIGEDVGIASVPVPSEGDTSYTTYGGRALVILKTDPERQTLAWEFSKFLMEEENNKTFITELGYLPVLKSLQDDPYFQDPARQPFVQELQNAVLPQMTASAEAVASAIQGVYQQVAVEDEVTPEQGVEAAAQAAQEALQTR